MPGVRVTQALARTPVALWSIRLALFSVGLVLVVLPLHRFAGFPTGLMLNVLRVGFAGAALAIILGIVAIAIIWRRGVPGGVAATAGILLSLALYCWPAALLPTLMSLPTINDITTDTANPPRFRALAARREPDANDPGYPGAQAAAAQSAAYPYLKPLSIDRSADEAYELALSAVKRLKWTIVALVRPGGGRRASGHIEAFDRTLILGFYDDVVIRVAGSNSLSRIDIRSASRFGRHDLGQNASRLQEFMRAFRARVEETVSIAAERAAARAAGRGRLKRRKGRGRSRRRRRR